MRRALSACPPFTYSLRSASTTAGSASVVVSPSARPSAMSRSRRRMILPERVLGRSAVKMISLGLGDARRSSRRRARLSSSRSASSASTPLCEGHEGGDRLALDRRAGAPTTAASATARVVDQRRSRPPSCRAVAGDVEDVVDPAQDPEVAVLVASRAVAGEVDRRGQLRPVGLHVALVVAPDACAACRATACVIARKPAAARLDRVARPRRRSSASTPGERAAWPSPAWSA